MNDQIIRMIDSIQDAYEFGFEWPHSIAIVKQMMSECKELEEDILSQKPPQKIQEELGDLIHAAFSFCLFWNFDVEDTFLKINQKFEARMTALKSLTQQLNLENLRDQPIEFKLELWKKAKINLSDDAST